MSKYIEIMLPHNLRRCYFSIPSTWPIYMCVCVCVYTQWCTDKCLIIGSTEEQYTYFDYKFHRYKDYVENNLHIKCIYHSFLCCNIHKANWFWKNGFIVFCLTPESIANQLTNKFRIYKTKVGWHFSYVYIN